MNCTPHDAQAMLRYLTGAPLSPDQLRDALDAFKKVGDEWRHMDLVNIAYGALTNAASVTGPETQSQETK